MNDLLSWSHPIIRWAGSKRQLLPLLVGSIVPEFSRYVEPFAGSAALFFAIRPRLAVLGDLNAELIETYETLRAHPRLIRRMAAAIPDTKRDYYRTRRIGPGGLPGLQRAARFVYLNRYCFNAVYRTNRCGHFNVPRGSHTGTLPSEAAFYRASYALRRADLRCGDFERTLADVTRGDFVYLDPPYDTGRRRRYGEYGYGSFASPDIARLLRTLGRIDCIGAKFLLSYADTPTVRRATAHWHQSRLLVRRHVAGFARHRGRVRELLVANYALSEHGV